VKNFFLIVAAIILLAANSAQAADKWVTAYYTDWQTNAYPINRIDYTAVTHVVLAHWLTNSNGTLQTSGWESTCSSVVTPAHAAGVKVLMMLGGSDDVNYPSAASPTNQATLISSIESKISACGLDGVDLDWEVNVNTTNFISLAKNLRAANSSLIITAPVDATVQPASLAASLSTYCDQVNMMSYGNANMGSGWVSWYFSALAGDGTNHPDSIAKWVSAWETAGTPAAKIGVGVGFYANGWTSPVTGALQSTSGSSVPVQELPYGSSIANGGGLLSCYYNKSGGTYEYDPSPALSTEPSTPPEQPSISFPSGFKGASGCPTNTITWVTYEDEASVAAKAKYIVDNNLGGAIIWTVQEGATDPATGRNPLLDVLKLNLNGGNPAPLPQVGSSGAVSVAGPTTITVTGLPSKLGLVDIKWWNFSSSVAWDSSSDKGFETYGQPAAYTIQGSTNGTTWTNLSCTPSCNVTGEHYTGRQFVADLSGTGYTQIRMNISGIVGTNGGYDALTVNGKAGTNDINDAYLMFGDSVTANCWAAASNTGPTEQLGTQIHAARPTQFPVSTVGGQSGWVSATALDTSTYGIPNIQKFLQDMPAAKFVGVSLGTNDANDGVSAQTYCSNMQKIVRYIIAAGKTPIIPTIVASPSSAVQTNAPAMNACLATLEQNYPAVIVGPDLWTLFKGHSTSDGWFLDDLHPSLGTGCSAFQNAWTNTLLAAVYPAGGGSSTPPSVPTNLAATAPKSTQVNLTWGASTDPNYASSTLTYDVFRNGSQVATTAAGVTSYSDTGLAPSTSYTYTATASDPGGNTSAQSTSAKITTPADTTPPSVPTNVAAIAPNSTQVNVSWTASTDLNYASSALTYKVYRNGTLVKTTAAGATSYSDTGVVASTTYSYTVAAANPAGNVSAQSTAVTVNIQPNATTPTITPSTTTPAAGTAFPVTVGITVGSPAAGAAAPTGKITLTLDGATYATANLATTSGVTSAAFSVTIADGGSHNLQAIYAGDSNYAGSTSSTVAVTVSKGATVTTLTATPSTLSAGTPETLTATIAPANSSAGATNTFTGTVTFFDGSGQIGTATVTGNSATLPNITLSTTSAHALTAVYSGDDTWTGSTSNIVTLKAVLIPVTITLAVTPANAAAGQVVSMLATVTPTIAPASAIEQNPTGSVIFYNGTTILATVALSAGANNTSTAELLSTTLPAGQVTITAAYLGDLFYDAATSNPVAITIQDFSITPDPGNPPSDLDIVKGSSGQVSYTFTGLGGFNGQIAVTCAVPAQDDMTCTPNPTTLTPTGSVTFTVTTYLTGGPATARRDAPPLWPRAASGTALAALLSFLLPFGRRARIFSSHRQRLFLLVLLLGTLTASGIGCGSASRNVANSGGTPLGKTTLTITAASNVDNTVFSHTIYLSVNVLSPGATGTVKHAPGAR